MIIKPCYIIILLYLLPFQTMSQSYGIINKKKKELSQTKNDSLKVILLGDLAFEFLNIHFDSAQFYAQKSLKLAKKTKSKFLIADANSVNGTIARYLGNFNEAILFYEKCYKLRIDIKDSSGIYKILGNIGNAYLSLKNDNKTALKYYLRSLEIQKKLKLKKEIAITNINISSIYLIQHNYPEALNYLLQTEKIALKLKDNSILGKAYINLGELYSEMGQNEDAEKYFLKSLKYKRESGDSIGVTGTLNNLAALYEKQNKVKNALSITHHIINIRRYISDSIGLADAYSNAALLNLRINNSDEAIKMAGIAEEIYIKTGYESGIAFVSQVKGEIYLVLKKYNLASEKCLKSYSYWKNTEDINELSNSCKCLYLAHENLNNPVKAFQYLKEHQILTDSINKISDVSETIRSQAKYEFDKKHFTDSLNRAIIEEKKEIQRAEEKKSDQERIYLQQWIIIFVSLVFLLIVFVIIFSFRNHRIKQKAIYQQKLTETELMSLRAQMNPHFIFNCLSSIRNNVDKGDFENADKYLSTFSKLLRASLNSSRKPFISLKDEINYLSLYMEMESMRMNHCFEYQFTHSPEINAEETEIPVMIIQPFIENSIRHGISALNKKGEITILFEIKNTFLEIKVRDNGIGREKAAQYKKSQLKGQNQESLGMNITENRLLLLYPGVMNPVTITDLYDENNHPFGTEVKIILPLSKL